MQRLGIGEYFAPVSPLTVSLLRHYRFGRGRVTTFAQHSGRATPRQDVSRAIREWCAWGTTGPGDTVCEPTYDEPDFSDDPTNVDPNTGFPTGGGTTPDEDHGDGDGADSGSSPSGDKGSGSSPSHEGEWDWFDPFGSGNGNGYFDEYTDSINSRFNDRTEQGMHSKGLPAGERGGPDDEVSIPGLDLPGLGGGAVGGGGSRGVPPPNDPDMELAGAPLLVPLTEEEIAILLGMADGPEPGPVDATILVVWLMIEIYRRNGSTPGQKCSDEVKRYLQQNIDGACKGGALPKKCKSTDGCADMLAKANAYDKCRTYRTTMRRVCFPDREPDPAQYDGHKTVEDAMKKVVDDCNSLARGCPGFPV